MGYKLVGSFIALPDTSDEHACTICAFLVLEKYKELGIESILLVEGEKRVAAKGYRRIEMMPVFFEHDPQSQVLFDLLHEQGWDEIRLASTAFSIHNQNIAKESWFHLQIPQGYELFYWKDLYPRDREQLQIRKSEFKRHKKEYLDPLIIENFDVRTSLGVRKRATNEVVGWMINQAKSPELLCFGSLYVVPEERSKGLFYPLLANSIQRYFACYPHAGFYVAGENSKMKAVVKRMMGHLCDSIVERYYCKKNLYSL